LWRWRLDARQLLSVCFDHHMGAKLWHASNQGWRVWLQARVQHRRPL
jgi:hypothetical protein